MKYLKSIIATAVVTLSLGGPAAIADSCTEATQPDGSIWKTCVDNNGNMYCQKCPANGGVCYTVPCNSQ